MLYAADHADLSHPALDLGRPVGNEAELAVERLCPRVRIGHPQRHRLVRIDDDLQQRPPRYHPCPGRSRARRCTTASPTPLRRPRAGPTWRSRSAPRPARRRPFGSRDTARRSARRSRTVPGRLRKPGSSSTATGIRPRYVSCWDRTFKRAIRATSSMPAGRTVNDVSTWRYRRAPTGWAGQRTSCRSPRFGTVEHQVLDDRDQPIRVQEPDLARRMFERGPRRDIPPARRVPADFGCRRELLETPGTKSSFRFDNEVRASQLLCERRRGSGAIEPVLTALPADLTGLTIWVYTLVSGFREQQRQGSPRLIETIVPARRAPCE